MKLAPLEELPVLDDVDCDVCGPSRAARVDYEGSLLCFVCRDRIRRRHIEREESIRRYRLPWTVVAYGGGEGVDAASLDRREGAIALIDSAALQGAA